MQEERLSLSASLDSPYPNRKEQYFLCTIGVQRIKMRGQPFIISLLSTDDAA